MKLNEWSLRWTETGIDEHCYAKRLSRISVLISLAIVATSCSGESPSTPASKSSSVAGSTTTISTGSIPAISSTGTSSEGAIRARSEEFDNAFAEQEKVSLQVLLAESAQLSTGDFDIEGREQFVGVMGMMWSERPGIALVHQIEDVKLSDDSTQAMETGAWTEQWKDDDGDVTLQGGYSRHWAKHGSSWFLHAETLVPLTCTGASSYCSSS